MVPHCHIGINCRWENWKVAHWFHWFFFSFLLPINKIKKSTILNSNGHKIYTDNAWVFYPQSHYTHWNAVIGCWPLKNRKTQKEEICFWIEMEMNRMSLDVLEMIEGVSLWKSNARSLKGDRSFYIELRPVRSISSTFGYMFNSTP